MKLIIIEDEAELLNNLKTLLGWEKNIEVAGTFSAADEALKNLEKIAPEIILTDIGLPNMSGIEFIKAAKELLPDVNIVALTGFDDKATVMGAIKAGASGYILKGSSPRDIIKAIYEVHEGGVPMTPRIARAMLAEFQTIKTPALQDNDGNLTDKEIEVLKSLAEGMSYKEIASAHYISMNTVHTHIKSIYKKLHAKDKQDSILKARNKGII